MSDKLRVLFVDDESEILQGYRTLLRTKRREWDMVFAPGGREAMEAMDAQPFHVIITDMRMPVVDGVAVLEHALEACPGAVRIVLSGFADLNLSLRAAPLAHQYLNKPCDQAELQSTLERAASLALLPGGGDLAQIVGGIRTLPALPQTYWEVQRALDDPRCEMADLVQLIECDPGMTAKVLQLGNSGFFGARQRFSDLGRAVTYLGLNLLRQLVLMGAVATTFEDQGCKRCVVEWVQQVGLLRASLVQRMTETSPGMQVEATTAALLLDIGLLILACYAPERLASCPSQGSAVGCSRVRELCECGHDQAGALLLGLWGFPVSVLEAVTDHHLEPSAGPLDLRRSTFLAAYLIDEAMGLERSELDPSWQPLLDQWRLVAGELTGAHTTE